MLISSFKRAGAKIGKRLGIAHRKDFLKRLPKNSVGAELGVFRGAYTAHILQIVSPRELHLVDVWWEKFGETYPDWGPYTNFGKLKTKDAYNEVQDIVKKYDKKKATTFHVGDDLPYISKFDDHHFDWVYIDSSHAYEHTKKELELLHRKVKAGGYITGDDWQPNPKHQHYGVYKAVKEFCKQYGWYIDHTDGFGNWCIKRKK